MIDLGDVDVTDWKYFIFKLQVRHLQRGLWLGGPVWQKHVKKLLDVANQNNVPYNSNTWLSQALLLKVFPAESRQLIIMSSRRSHHKQRQAFEQNNGL